MRKSFLLITILVAGHFFSFSQKTAIGFQAGFNFSAMVRRTDSGRSVSSLLPGITAGVLLDLPLSGHISYQLGLNFMQKGGTERSCVAGKDQRVETRMNCLEMPAHLRYYSKSKEQGFFTGAGLSLCFGIGGRIISTDFSPGQPDQVAVGKLKFGINEDDHLDMP